MKNLVILLIALLCISLSCKESNEKDNPTDVETTDVNNDSVETSECLILDHQIYFATAQMWQNSWLAENPGYSGQQSPTIHFTRDNLLKLRNQNTAINEGNHTNAGVRMYYILFKDSPDKIPALALVNIEGCSDQSGCPKDQCVLVSDVDGFESFVSLSEFKADQTRWLEYADGKQKLLPVNIAVYAYNYPWLNIEAAGIDDGNGIWIKYGKRSLGPSDSMLFTGDFIDYAETGNIVYCNIMYGNEPGTINQDFFDFARPCPDYCGGEQ